MTGAQMDAAATAPGAAAQTVQWLLSEFMQTVAHVDHAIVLSRDGMQLAVSRGINRDLGDQLAAQAAGLLALGQQCGLTLGLGGTGPLHLRLDGGHLLFLPIQDTAGLMVIAPVGADLRVLGAAMARFVGSVGAALAPGQRSGTGAVS